MSRLWWRTYRDPMAQFLVETYADREAANSITEGLDDVSLAADALGDEGPEVRLLQAIFVPEDETCFYVYESSSLAAVREAVTRAGLQFDRITGAVSTDAAPRLPRGRRVAQQ